MLEPGKDWIVFPKSHMFKSQPAFQKVTAFGNRTYKEMIEFMRPSGWGPNPIQPVSWSEVVTPEMHIGRKGHMECCERTTTHKPRRVPEKQNLPTPRSETFSLQNCRTMNIYHLSHPVGDLCYGSPSKLKQGHSHYLPWTLQQGLESGLRKSGDHCILWGLKAVSAIDWSR